MILTNFVVENRYLDSVMLMSAAAKVKETPGVEEVSVMMGTEANKGLLRESGMLDSTGEGAKAADLVVAVKAESEGAVEEALKKVEALLSGAAAEGEEGDAYLPKSLGAAVQKLPDANLVVISLPGPYVRREALAALEAGLHVMIFSDNVTVEEEVEIKKRSKELGLLVMGPDCGTAILSGTALGFANVIPKGPFGIVGASGTGIQEVSCILANRGSGITHAIGLGGRDLKKEVGGISMLQGIAALEEDPDTEVIVLISKPPAEEVARMVLDRVKGSKKKIVVNFLKGDPAEAEKRGLAFAPSLEEAAERALSLLKDEPFEKRDFTGDEKEIRKRAETERKKVGEGKCLRGLFSGGTLADEALLILSTSLGDIHSNIPLREDLQLKESAVSEGHTIVDLGEDEFTRGRPHPMIDYTLRCERLLDESKDPATGVIILDVVLGYGSHPDPASELLPPIRKARQIAAADGRRIAFVASVCGTDSDPQNRAAQVAALEGAGVHVLPTNAQAARFAALILNKA